MIFFNEFKFLLTKLYTSKHLCLPNFNELKDQKLVKCYF